MKTSYKTLLAATALVAMLSTAATSPSWAILGPGQGPGTGPGDISGGPTDDLADPVANQRKGWKKGKPQGKRQASNAHGCKVVCLPAGRIGGLVLCLNDGGVCTPDQSVLTGGAKCTDAASKPAVRNAICSFANLRVKELTDDEDAFCYPASQEAETDRDGLKKGVTVHPATRGTKNQPIEPFDIACP